MKHRTLTILAITTFALVVAIGTYAIIYIGQVGIERVLQVLVSL